MKLTLREVSWRLESINNRKSGEMKLQAKFHNMEFKDHNKSVCENTPEMLEKIEIAKKQFESGNFLK